MSASLADAWRALLADARGLVPDTEIRAAITTEIGQLGQLAGQGAAAVEDHVVRWLTGAYTGPDGAVGSPAGQPPAAPPAAPALSAEPLPGMPGMPGQVQPPA